MTAARLAAARHTGFLAYGIWGLFPLYFAALKPAGAWEILAHRILWTLLLCALVLLVRRDLAWIRPLLGSGLGWCLGITMAALLIAMNWVVYVAAVLGGRTYEAALGYFLNPIVTVAPGRRRPRRAASTAAVGGGGHRRSSRSSTCRRRRRRARRSRSPWPSRSGSTA